LQGEPGLVSAYDAVVRSGCNARATAVVCVMDMFTALNNLHISFLDR